ncbi:hypothetical protein P9K38_07560 [Pseudomonas sp. 905_Psudmo1]|nr:hypothetical protein [Pseudomonas sp. 905_Psudmo1]WFS20183.1 hypothetical protein P9K38_07560 [Pseudomonas sp. 905_Psudmo1]
MKLALLVFMALFIASCSSISSIEKPSKVEGLTYYMPKKDFVVTVVVKGGNIEDVSLGVTPAYADMSKQYVLSHRSSVFGKNTLDVSVTDKGLLATSKSTTVSSLSEAFKSLATSYGRLDKFLAVDTVPADKACAKDGEHIFTYSGVNSTETPCGLKVTIETLGGGDNVVGHSKKEDESHSGVFYRQNEPYKISVTGNGLNFSSIVFSPSRSSTFFLPVSKTLFANNEAEFQFNDGVPEKYKQDVDGEAVALLKLPADVIGAYFGAVGSVFDSFKSNDQKESEAINASLSLEIAKKKYAACLEALNAGDKALVESLNCK